MDTHRDQTDYYTLLGVPTDASSSAIKAAFKHLALRYHPDVYHGEDAEERMRQLLLAYQTLSNPARRQAYDAQRAGTWEAEQQPRSTAQPRAENRYTSRGSPGGRRDHTRPYAFPEIRDGAPVHFMLGEVSYDLSAEEASRLKQQGLLRGIAREATEALPAEVRQSFPHSCHRCHYRWVPAEVDARPARLWELICPACKAADWAEYLLMRCVHCRAVFESEQIREEIGAASGQLYSPYALFPLCPSCRAARWCPAEDARLDAVRRQVARKSAWFKTRR